jgi:hypothetical protein
MMEWKIRPALCAILLLACALPTAYAFLSGSNRILQTAVDPTTYCTGNIFGIDKDGWIALSIIALLMNFAFVSFAYIFGGFFNWPQVTSWTKEFLYSLIVSMLILFLFMAATAGLELAGYNNIDTAQRYSRIIQLTMTRDFMMMTGVTAGVSLIGNQSVFLRPAGIIGFSFQLSAVFRPIFDALGLLLNVMIASVAEWYTHQFLLCFFKNTLFVLMFPAGLFLRCYGFTKGAGDALIGLAMGFFFIYPLMLNLSAYVISTHFGPPTEMDLANELNPRSVFSFTPSANLCGTSRDCSWNTGLRLQLKGLYDMVGQPQNMMGIGFVFLLLKYFGASALASSLLPLAAGSVFAAMSVVAYFVVVISIILPIFNIFLTLTFSREVAKYLGTEIDLSAIEKLL